MAKIVCFLLICFIASVTSKLLSATYPGLGTFKRNDFYNLLHRPLLYLPQSPEDIDVTFHLFTRSNSKDEDMLEFNSTESLRKSHFNKKLPTKVYIHGFMASIDMPGSMRTVKDAYLKYEDVNVILVDWSKGAWQLFGQATVNQRIVGAIVGTQIQLICKEYDISPDTFHVIGHSMGAHTAGFTGKFLNGALGRITGLEPNGIYATGVVPEGRLWYTDAKFVDAIHTDAPEGVVFGWGMKETCAHLDIFVNGGSQQPGCPIETATFFLDQINEWVDRLVYCSHNRSITLFIESLNDSIPLPKAYQCDSYKDYTAGECLDCGSNGEKCALLGARGIEYADHISSSFSSTVDGKRWFLVTDRHQPLLPKYQYLIQTGETPSIFNFLVEKLNLLTLKFTDNSGNTEDLKIEDKSVISNLFKRKGSIAGVLAIDPKNLQSIQIKFPQSVVDSSLKLVKLHREKITVVGLTSSDSTPKSAATKTEFCNPEPKFSLNVLKKVTFERCDSS